jgi:tRNA(Ile)-lysidine synthase TilS/MesJ
VARSHCWRDLAENLCEELVVLRIIYRVLDDNQFATMIKQQTPTEIVEVIKNILWPHGSITNPC